MPLCLSFKKAALATALLIGSSVGFAQSRPSMAAQPGPFEGFSAGADVAFVGTGMKDATTDSYGKQSMGLRIHGDYGIAIDRGYLVTLGASYALSNADIKVDSDGSTRVKGAYALYAAPGMLINDKAMLFAKLSLEGASMDMPSASTKVNGVGVGIGLKTMLDRSSYLSFEASRVNYGSATPDVSTTGYTLSTTSALVGMGFAF